jgi:hypothetical protein
MMRSRRCSWGQRYYFADSQCAADIPDDDEAGEFDTVKDACDEAERALRETAANTTGKTLWMSVFGAGRKLVQGHAAGGYPGGRRGLPVSPTRLLDSPATTGTTMSSDSGPNRTFFSGECHANADTPEVAHPRR